jgi:arginyl-tRNA synthetase
MPFCYLYARRDGERWHNAGEDQWLASFRGFAADEMMTLIRADLAALGVRHDVFTSERALVEKGAIDRVVGELERRDLVYTGTLEPPKGKPAPEDWEPRPQLLFRATAFGDDVDRPLRKSDGSWTYFASDIAYHRDKVRRGFAQMVDVWGADHKGYVKRMKAAVEAVSAPSAIPMVKIRRVHFLRRLGWPRPDRDVIGRSSPSISISSAINAFPRPAPPPSRRDPRRSPRRPRGRARGAPASSRGPRR